MMAVRAAIAACAVALLAGCDDPAPRDSRAQAPGSMAEGRPAAAMQATEERLRARLRREGPLTLRAVQGYRQAMAEVFVICGQVNPGGGGNEPYIPFVASVTFEAERVAQVEFHLAATSPEATRVYYEMVDRCFDGGGPPNARATVRPLPPAPSVQPGAAYTPPADPPPMPAATTAVPVILEPSAQRLPPAPEGGGIALGTASVRSPANIRAHPSGGGEVLRVAPRGATLQVFAEAPGGWLQVGDGEPWGWVHGSLLDR
jgi:hypothetical protein